MSDEEKKNGSIVYLSREDKLFVDRGKDLARNAYLLPNICKTDPDIFSTQSDRTRIPDGR